MDACGRIFTCLRALIFGEDFSSDPVSRVFGLIVHKSSGGQVQLDTAILSQVNMHSHVLYLSLALSIRVEMGETHTSRSSSTSSLPVLHAGSSMCWQDADQQGCCGAPNNSSSSVYSIHSSLRYCCLGYHSSFADLASCQHMLLSACRTARLWGPTQPQLWACKKARLWGPM